MYLSCDSWDTWRGRGEGNHRWCHCVPGVCWQRSWRLSRHSTSHWSVNFRAGRHQFFRGQRRLRYCCSDSNGFGASLFSRRCRSTDRAFLFRAWSSICATRHCRARNSHRSSSCAGYWRSNILAVAHRNSGCHSTMLTCARCIRDAVTRAEASSSIKYLLLLISFAKLLEWYYCMRTAFKSPFYCEYLLWELQQ